jgi:hypothetical protein
MQRLKRCVGLISQFHIEAYVSTSTADRYLFASGQLSTYRLA